jgi:hypothetical protein
MKRITVPMMCLLIFLSLGLLSYAQTVMTDVWKDKEYRGPVKKITVLCIAQDRGRRIVLEDLFIAQLKARGTDAMPGYVVIPPDKLVDSETALTKIRGLGSDSILTVRLVSKLTIQTEIPEPGKTDQTQSSRWSNYYRYVFDAPTRETDEPAYLETNLFDSANQKRVWTARSVTKVDMLNHKVAEDFIKVITDQLASDKMIK